MNCTSARDGDRRLGALDFFWQRCGFAGVRAPVGRDGSRWRRGSRNEALGSPIRASRNGALGWPRSTSSCFAVDSCVPPKPPVSNARPARVPALEGSVETAGSEGAAGERAGVRGFRRNRRFRRRRRRACRLLRRRRRCRRCRLLDRRRRCQRCRRLHPKHRCRPCQRGHRRCRPY